MSGDHQTLALLLFSAFVAVTLFITRWAGRTRQCSAEEFYAGGRLFSPMENGFAIAGDYMSAASFLGISGLIALFGYDGMLYSVGFLVAWLAVLLFVAELVRNCGRFTLAVVAGITLASSASVAHDLYASLRRPGRRKYGEVAVARTAAAGIGVVAIGLGLLAQDLNVAFLVGLAFAVAASANLPALLYSLFWRGFTTRGAVWAVYGGLVPAVVLVLVSPVVSGSPTSLFPGADFQLFPLENPGLVSIPLGFLAGWIGTVTSPEPPDEAKHAEAEVRALTGAGAA
ncbi:hypothetical protein [Streptomyces sp. NPDC091649]|uniref:sodium:solute symporter family transporter n=1 Tax=Streptomyces sp. NPDC091649 TaxID=3366004 RepID=UPI00380B5F72